MSFHLSAFTATFAEKILQMNIGISQYGLSTSILNKISINNENDGNSCVVDVQINGRSIFTTTLYCNAAGYAHLYDLGILINDYMRSHILTLAHLGVVASFEHHADDADVYVVYSSLRFSYEDDFDFLKEHFLTTRTFYTVPRKANHQIAFSVYEDLEQLTGALNISYKLKDGSVHTHRIEESLRDFGDTMVYYYNISAKTLEQKLKDILAKKVKVLSCSVSFGKRSLDFYFIDDEPVDTFHFFNAFNIREAYYVYGTQKIKTEFTQKEALSSEVATYYGQSSERKVEIETVPLGLEEAEWLNQFLGSQYVFKTIPPDNDQRVLISDIDSEISDSAKDQVIIKFRWKFAEPYNWKVFDDHRRRFTDKFNETYE